MNKDIITGYCGDKKRLFFVLIFAGLLPFIAQTCPAQSNYLYGSDTRTSLVEFMAGERKQLGGDFAFGGNFIRGNADINYLNSNFGIFKFWERRSVYIKGFVLYNTSGAQKTINQGMESIRYDQCFGKPLKVFIFNTNAYNDFIRLNYRTTSGLGLWYAFAHNAANHGFSIAVTHEYENFKAGLIERAARLSVRNLSAFEISNTAEISADFFYVPKFTEFGDYHIYAEIALNTLIFKDKLGAKISWIDEYDSRPKSGIKSNTIIWLTSLVLHFGK